MLFEDIIRYINDQTVTAADFNYFIRETKSKNVKERVRREVQPLPYNRTSDTAGHSRLADPNPVARAATSPEPITRKRNDPRSTGRGRAMLRKQRTLKSKYTEAVEFIQSRRGKPLSEAGVKGIKDKPALNRLTTRLLRENTADQDWLYELYKLTQE